MQSTSDTTTALSDVNADSRRGAIVQALAVLATAAPVILVALWSMLWVL